MPAADLYVRLLHREEVDCVLRLADGRGRLDDRPEDDRHAVGDASVDASVVVGLCYDPAASYPETVIGLTSSHTGHGKTASEFYPLDCADREEYRLSYTRLKTKYYRLQYAAYRVAVVAGGFDALYHLRCGIITEDGKHFVIERGKLCFGIVPVDISVSDTAQLADVAADKDPSVLESLPYYRAGGDDDRCEPPGEMPSAACILIAVVLHLCRIIGMTRTCYPSYPVVIG